MAIYYCIHGATNNGDGTTSAEAGTPGGVGAFNDAKAVLDGTEAGLPAAPYTVVFKTNHSASDITLSYSASTTIAYGTGYANRITYIFDDGTVWPGEGGTFTMQFSAGSLLSANGSSDTLSNRCADLIGTDYNFVIEATYATGTLTYFYLHSGIVKGMYFKKSAAIDTSRKRIALANYRYNQTKLVNCKVDVLEAEGTDFAEGQVAHSPGVGALFPGRLDIDGLVFNLIFHGADTGRASLLNDHIDDIGSNVSNVLIQGSSGNPWSINCSVTKLVYSDSLDLVVNSSVSVVKKTNQVESFDFIYNGNEGVNSRWEAGSNYPTFNALLPDGLTSWSIRVDTSGIIEGSDSQIFNHTKLYDQGASVRTLTLEALIPDSFVSPTSLDWYAIFTYEDSSGNLQSLTTLSTAALSTSTASWSTATYAAITYNKYNFEVTTPTAIKDDTTILIALYTKRQPINSNEFYFIDPDITVT